MFADSLDAPRSGPSHSSGHGTAQGKGNGPIHAHGAESLVDRRQVNLLIVDDEQDFREAAEAYFYKLGYPVRTAENGQAALAQTEQAAFDVAIVDIHMPGIDGVQVLTRLREQDGDLQVIMLTGGGTIENAVESMKAGAFDFLTKPAKLPELDLVIQKAFRHLQLEKENRRLRFAIKSIAPPGTMIGDSPAIREVYRLIDKTATTLKPVLVEGESGTGKELVARAIHEKSALADKPLIVINCAALPESLLESELFGHEKGAFTGAVGEKPGLFEIADGGTLFIDELGELAGSLQAKLLRVLEDGSLRRVGSVKERKVNVRLIAATNQALGQAVDDGKFREDLYYRINVLKINLPPLRERAGDVERLIEHFVGPPWEVEPEVIRILTQYSWPGNVRQLQNAIDRAKILADDHRILVENLPPEITSQADQVAVQQVGNPGLDLESINRAHVLQVYEKHGKNKTRTAQALGIGRRSLYRLLEKYDIH